MAFVQLPEITDPAIPAFCAKLPQRAAAYRANIDFAAKHGFPLPALSERRIEGKNVVSITGLAPDGREFGIGYEWSAEQAARYST